VLEAGVIRPPTSIGTHTQKRRALFPGHHPVAYQGARGIASLLEGMSSARWEPIMSAATSSAL